VRGVFDCAKAERLQKVISIKNRFFIFIFLVFFFVNYFGWGMHYLLADGVVFALNERAAVTAIKVKELCFFIYPHLVDVGQGFKYSGCNFGGGAFLFHVWIFDL
jgi:hypothetical protein